MWYVIQVRSGTEEKICLQCRRLIDDMILIHCFIPYYKAKKKYLGKWHTEERILFPGYVFMITDFPEKLYLELKKVSGLTKMLGTGSDVIPLTGEEVKFLKTFGREEQIVDMSEGIIENDKIKILRGPLKGQEGFIKKIDRHKRKAYLEVGMFGRTVEMQVGVEIVAKY